MSAEGVIIPFDTERQKRLAVECPACAKREKEKQALAEQTEAMATDILGLERELKKYRRKVNALEKQIASKDRDPNHKLAERLFEYWKKVTGHSKAVYDLARENQILKALKLLEKAYGDDSAKALGAAFLGAAKGGYVDATGKRHDGIALICRDAENLEKNIDRYRAYMRGKGEEPVV